MLSARDIMTENVVTISPQASIQEAIETLLNQEFSGLPVADKDGKLVGIVTEFALLGLVYDHRIRADVVAKHMTTELLTVDVNDPVSKVADLCLVHRVRRVPVMDQGRLVGLIARRDVLRALYEAKAPACTT
jgi:CBS domain-containing protein